MKTLNARGSRLLVLIGSVGFAFGCSSEGDGGAASTGNGGVSSTGGEASGGAGVGGAATGGTGVGGVSTGGIATGGAGVGGNGISGGASSGGGLGTGGAGTGGAATGGAATGGAATGGAATGGAATGGTSSTVAGCTGAGTSGDSNKSVQVGTRTRTYVMHTPPGYDGTTPLPVVIDFHPLGGTGSGWKGSTGWGAVADSKKFIMVWPDGVGSSWNVGRCCETALNQQVDDVAFVRAMIEQLKEETCVDPKRVFATGCSNGGGMTYKVACEAADVIAAAAPVDFDCVVGPTNDPSCGGCDPARAIPVMQFRGTNDVAVRYEGGQAPIPPTMRFPGAVANFEDWADINECSGSPSPLPAKSACSVYSSCDEGSSVALCTVQGGTHCGSYQSFGIATLAWELFEKSALP